MVGIICLHTFTFTKETMYFVTSPVIVHLTFTFTTNTMLFSSHRTSPNHKHLSDVKNQNFTFIRNSCNVSRPPMAKKGMFGQKWAILGPFLHHWVQFSDEFCIQSSPPTCVPMCTTICSNRTSLLGPSRPPMAKKAFLAKHWPFWGQ